MKIFFVLLFLSTGLLAQDEFNLKLKTLDSEVLDTKELYANGALLVNFWATWCQPCKAEIPYLNELYAKYKNNGLRIVGINQDSQKSVAKVKSFVSAQKIEFPIVLDTNFEIFNKVNGQVIPYSLLINKQGKIIYRHTGYNPGDEKKLEEEILKILLP